MKENNTDKLCISVDEMAMRLGISRAGAFALVHSNGFPSIRVGRRLLVPLVGLERWLEQQAEGKGEFA